MRLPGRRGGPAALALATALFPAILRAQSDLPEGPGKAVTEKVCHGCHSFVVITQSRATKDHWEAIVDNMVSRGAEGTDDELEQVVVYLTSNFGPDKPLKINVNKAGAEELARVLALSRENAAAIVQYREKNGVFKDLPALKSVPGIDAAKIEEHKDRIEF